MSLYTQLRLEFQEKNKTDRLFEKQVRLAEQAIFQDLVRERGKCDKCPSTDNLTLEHIVPTFILLCFGVKNEIIEENYGLTCRRCNNFKSGKLDFTYPQTKQVLLKLLERV